MSEMVESQTRKHDRLWPMAVVIFAIVFSPALLAWAINLITH